MNEQINTELIKAMNEMANNEATVAKIEASIFVRESERLVNEKVAYLYNMIKIDSKNCNQRQDTYFDDEKLIISHYKQKLNMVYDEFYCQYANIQKELQEANNNRKLALIHYQKKVNQEDNAFDDDQKEDLRRRNETYKKIVEMCNSKFESSRESFEKMIEEEFKISSKSLQIISEQNIFQRIISRFSNLFTGNKKYLEILSEYNKAINNIDSHEIVEKMRNDTIEFVADVIEVKGIDETELEENVRIGGKNEII